MNENIKRSGVVNLDLINTEEELADFLDTIGFKSRPISKERSDARVWHQSSHSEPPPQRELSWEDNKGFEESAVISKEKGILYLQYYEGYDNLFKVWEKFKGEVEIDKIQKSIRSAVTRTDVAIKFSYFWPERIQSDGSLARILKTIGFRSKDIKWPDGLPCAGESVIAPHQLIAANEHNLDTDAIVSVESLTANIYYRDPASNVYRLWAKLKTEKTKPDDLPEIEYSKFYSAIMSAMTAKKETETFVG
jgi:hypothetical protein